MKQFRTPPMPEARTPVALASLPKDVLVSLSAILDRARRANAPAAGPVKRPRFESDLLDVFHAAGVAHDGSVAEELWHELAEPTPDHKALALGYRRMAAADASLDPGICTPELRPGLQRHIRLRWPSRTSIAAMDWSALHPAGQGAIRAMAQRLAAWHGSHVRVARPRKNDLDTLLDLLADVFGRHGGWTTGLHELPHAVEGHFIRFAATALAPFYDPSEVTPTALARRWKRAKVAGIA
jgi:hypothetical protein